MNFFQVSVAGLFSAFYLFSKLIFSDQNVNYFPRKIFNQIFFSKQDSNFFIIIGLYFRKTRIEFLPDFIERKNLTGFRKSSIFTIIILIFPIDFKLFVNFDLTVSISFLVIQFRKFSIFNSSKINLRTNWEGQVIAFKEIIFM